MTCICERSESYRLFELKKENETCNRAFITFTRELSVEVGRRKKLPKHANMLIPILILFKVFKVKVLVALVLAGIFFIKKVIIVGAMVLPSLLHSVKTACKYHFAPHHHDHESYVSSFGGDYGGYYGGDHSGKGAWADRFYHNRPNNQQ